MWTRLRRWLARKLWPGPWPTAPSLPPSTNPLIQTGSRYMIVEHYGHNDHILCRTDSGVEARHYWEAYQPRAGAITEFRDGAICRATITA